MFRGRGRELTVAPLAAILILPNIVLPSAIVKRSASFRAMFRLPL